MPASTTCKKLKGKVTTSSASSAPADREAASTSSANAKQSSASTKPEDKTEAHTPAATVASSTTHKHVDVNTATQQELEAVPGIGQATAKKIIAGRPYKSLSELSRAGVPNATIQKAHSYLSVSHPKTKVAPVAASTAATEPGLLAERARRPLPQPGPHSSAKAAPKTASTGRGRPRRRAPEAEVMQAHRAVAAGGMVWVNTNTKVYHYEGDRGTATPRKASS